MRLGSSEEWPSGLLAFPPMPANRESVRLVLAREFVPQFPWRTAGLRSRGFCHDAGSFQLKVFHLKNSGSVLDESVLESAVFWKCVLWRPAKIRPHYSSENRYHRPAFISFHEGHRR